MQRHEPGLSSEAHEGERESGPQRRVQAVAELVAPLPALPAPPAAQPGAPAPAAPPVEAPSAKLPPDAREAAAPAPPPTPRNDLLQRLVSSVAHQMRNPLVAIRTFLSWTLVLEIEGRWPWQRGKHRS